MITANGKTINEELSREARSILEEMICFMDPEALREDVHTWFNWWALGFPSDYEGRDLDQTDKDFHYMNYRALVKLLSRAMKYQKLMQLLEPTIGNLMSEAETSAE